MKTQDKFLCDMCGEYVGFGHGHTVTGGKLYKPEKQEIEIAEEVPNIMWSNNEIAKNRKLIIELQEVVNKLLKE